MSVLLSARNLSRVYKAKSGDVTALNDFSYDFEGGLFFPVTFKVQIMCFKHQMP